MAEKNNFKPICMEGFLLKHNIEDENWNWIAKFYQDIYNEICGDPESMEKTESQIIKDTENFVLGIINSYQQAKELGHSDVFSRVYAEVFYMEEDEPRAKFAAYRHLESADKNMTYDEIKELVHSEAYLECLKQGKDPIESKRYAQAITDIEFEDRAAKIAKQYYLNYSRSINAGNSTVYSEVFADSASTGETIEFAHRKAKIYEEQILAGNGEEYAEYFSDRLAGEIIEADMRGLINSDKDRDYYKLKARVWAYVYFEKKGYDQKNYGEIYENIYLNYYFGNDSKDIDFVVHEELEQKAEEMYRKRMNRGPGGLFR